MDTSIKETRSDPKKLRPSIWKVAIASFVLSYSIYLCWGSIKIAQLAEAIDRGFFPGLAFRGFLSDIIGGVLFTGFCLGLIFIPILYLLALAFARLTRGRQAP